MSIYEEDLTPDEAEVLAIYRSKDDAGKAWMIAYLEEVLKEVEKEAAEAARRKRLTLVVSKP